VANNRLLSQYISPLHACCLLQHQSLRPPTEGYEYCTYIAGGWIGANCTRGDPS
jgi:hypothetical protein